MCVCVCACVTAAGEKVRAVGHTVSMGEAALQEPPCTRAAAGRAERNAAAGSLEELRSTAITSGDG